LQSAEASIASERDKATKITKEGTYFRSNYRIPRDIQTVLSRKTEAYKQLRNVKFVNLCLALCAKIKIADIKVNTAVHLFQSSMATG
jgi:hypothetical protein